MNSQSYGFRRHRSLAWSLLAILMLLSGCTNTEKAKADHVKRGEAYLKESKFQEAALEFRNAVQIDDNLAAAHWGLAQAYEGLQRFPEMLDELRKTVALDKSNFEARLKLGNYYVTWSKGSPEALNEAERLANEVLERDANNIEGHILIGSIMFARGEKDKALAELNKAIELNPSRVESYLSMALFYIATNDGNKAEELFKRAISVNGNSALAHTEYGRFLSQANRLTEAEAELTKAVEVGPTDRHARTMLASFYFLNKQLDKAEASYKALAALDADKPQSQSVVADFYSSVGRLDEAIKIYQDILRQAPDYVPGRYRLAEILIMRGDPQAGNAQIEEVLKKDAHDRPALLLK